MYTVRVLAFKCVKGLAPSHLSDLLVTRSTVYDRNIRNKDYLNILSYQSAAGQRTFLYRAIKLWNSLPRAITAADSPRVFKKKLREFLFESIRFRLDDIGHVNQIPTIRLGLRSPSSNSDENSDVDQLRAPEQYLVLFIILYKLFILSICLLIT